MFVHEFSLVSRIDIIGNLFQKYQGIDSTKRTKMHFMQSDFKSKFMGLHFSAMWSSGWSHYVWTVRPKKHNWTVCVQKHHFSKFLFASGDTTLSKMHNLFLLKVSSSAGRRKRLLRCETLPHISMYMDTHVFTCTHPTCLPLASFQNLLPNSRPASL